MVGRGKRIEEESGKLMFPIFDYTGCPPTVLRKAFSGQV